jgi:hypothetical protein
MRDWLEDEHGEPCLADHRWPMAPTHLLPLERWLWWEQLWAEVVMLRRRYRLVPAKDWWEDEAKVEVLAALAAWVARYDSGEWDDPAGKLALLYDLECGRERVRGNEPFDRRAATPRSRVPDRSRVSAAACRDARIGTSLS